jgi:hypothetical protein
VCLLQRPGRAARQRGLIQRGPVMHSVVLEVTAGVMQSEEVEQHTLVGAGKVGRLRMPAIQQRNCHQPAWIGRQSCDGSHARIEDCSDHREGHKAQ